jgi:hypothetical protein
MRQMDLTWTWAQPGILYRIYFATTRGGGGRDKIGKNMADTAGSVKRLHIGDHTSCTQGGLEQADQE